MQKKQEIELKIRDKNTRKPFHLKEGSARMMSTPGTRAIPPSRSDPKKTSFPLGHFRRLHGDVVESVGFEVSIQPCVTLLCLTLRCVHLRASSTTPLLYVYADVRTTQYPVSYVCIDTSSHIWRFGVQNSPRKVHSPKDPRRAKEIPEYIHHEREHRNSKQHLSLLKIPIPNRI